MDIGFLVFITKRTQLGFSESPVKKILIGDYSVLKQPTSIYWKLRDFGTFVTLVIALNPTCISSYMILHPKSFSHLVSLSIKQKESSHNLWYTDLDVGLRVRLFSSYPCLASFIHFLGIADIKLLYPLDHTLHSLQDINIPLWIRSLT